MHIIVSIVLCLLLKFCSCSGNDVERHKKYLDAICAVYNLTIWPNNNYVIETGILPDIFNHNVQARVYDFAIHYTGPLDVAEYFYGLTPNNYTYETLTVVIKRVDINRFIVQGNIAFTSINYVSVNLQTGVETNGTQLGQWRFDKNGKIKEIDNVQVYYDLGFRESVPPAAYPYYVDALIEQICTRHEKNCNGSNQQYANYTECDAFIRTLQFGSPSMNQWNSGVCRWWHSFLTYLRPSIHCMHVGPTGGGICVDYTLSSLYQPFFPEDEDRLVGPARFVRSITAQNIRNP